MPTFNLGSSKSNQITCIVPKDSKIIKDGELMKIGNKTGVMRTRYYILRDHGLFIYNNR